MLLLFALVVGATLITRFSRGPVESDGPRFALQSKPPLLPPLRFIDGMGRATSLEQMHGKVVLLNLWATWCPPCRKEMPSLDRLQAKLGGNDLEVVALSIDAGGNGLTAVKSFYAGLDLRSLRVYNDPEGMANILVGASGVPTTLLLDRTGHEIGRVVGPAQWDSPETIALVRRLAGLAAAP